MLNSKHAQLGDSSKYQSWIAVKECVVVRMAIVDVVNHVEAVVRRMSMIKICQLQLKILAK